GRAQVLDGVHLRRAHHRLAVGRGHAQIEGGDGRAVHAIHAGNVEAGQKAQVVDLETGDLLHGKTSHQSSASRGRMRPSGVRKGSAFTPLRARTKQRTAPAANAGRLQNCEV